VRDHEVGTTGAINRLEARIKKLESVGASSDMLVYSTDVELLAAARRAGASSSAIDTATKVFSTTVSNLEAFRARSAVQQLLADIARLGGKS
jgi:hypothetical protein